MTPDERIINWIDRLVERAQEKGMLPGGTGVAEQDPEKLRQIVNSKRKYEDAVEVRDDFTGGIMDIVRHFIHGDRGSKEDKLYRQQLLAERLPGYNKPGFGPSRNVTYNRYFPTVGKGKGGVFAEAIPEKHRSGEYYPEWANTLGPLARYAAQVGMYTKPLLAQGADNISKSFTTVGEQPASAPPASAPPVSASNVGLLSADVGSNAQAQTRERALEPILNMISQRGSPADKGILAGIDWSRLFQTMAGMPGAHMQHPYGGGSFLTDFAISGENVAAARSAAALEREKLRSKERAAGASKRPKLTGPASKAIDGYFSGIRGKKLTDELRTVMLERFTSGIGSDAIGLLTGIGSFLGVDMGETGGMQAKGIADLVKNELAASGLFGDQTSKAELRLLIDKIVKNPGTIKNEEAVRQSLDRLDNLFDNMRIRAEAKLITFDYDVEKLKRSYDSRVNPGKVWSKE